MLGLFLQMAGAGNTELRMKPKMTEILFYFNETKQTPL